MSALYYQGEGVTGQGSRMECLTVTSQTYTLMVILPSGEQIPFTVTLFAG